MIEQDWSSSTLGAPQDWSNSLRLVFDLMLASKFPMFVAWGSELRFLYNDAYAEILGDKHPNALGSRFADIWAEIWPDILPLVQAAMAGEASYKQDLPLLMKRKGFEEQTWFTFSYSPVRDESGQVAGMFCVCTETTAQVVAERALAESEKRFRNMADNAPVMMWVTDPQGYCTYLNRAWYEFTGQDADYARGFGWLDAIYPDDRGEAERVFREANAAKAAFRIEYRLRRADGSYRWAIDAAAPRYGEDGAHHGYVGSVIDIDERREAEERQQQSEAALRRLTNALPAFVWFATPDGELHYFNDVWYAYTGQSVEDALPNGWASTVHPDDVSATAERWTEARAKGTKYEAEIRYRRRDGTYRWYVARAEPVRDETGAINGWVGTSIDIHDRKEAETALRASETHFRMMADAVPQIVWITDADGRAEFFNRQWFTYTGAADVQKTAGEIAAEHVHPEDQLATMSAFAEARRSGKTFQVEHRIRSAAGEYRWFLVRGEPSLEPVSGLILRWYGTSLDIHDRKLAESDLKEANQTLERQVAAALAERKILADIVEGTNSFVQVVGRDFRWLALNNAAADEFVRVYGRRPRPGDCMLDLLKDMPDQQAAAKALWQRALSGDEFTQVVSVETREGGRLHHEMRFNTLRDAQGKVIAAYQFVHDVTERMREQERLREAEEALRQSQKMEAMGQLTGGVAHDFNNLLTPIIGSLDLLQRRGVGTEREQKMIAGAAQSAERAKTLVQRLLAFARRQPLQAVAVDISRLVKEMGELINSTTGPQITVIIDAPSELPPAKADPNQVEMAILNLAVNARDAMPDGGTLRISAIEEHLDQENTIGLPPGDYLRLSVADTGAGMDQATLARAVEPFFSTKGIGRGTGLGLSMVHGLASQLGGTLAISSRVGIGTNVELWLPRSAASVSNPGDAKSESVPRLDRTVTVLLVDDELLVRLSTADILQDLGYDVIEAGSADEAMATVERGEQFDLLITDHLMPGMTGTQLIALMRERRPGVPALLISGYADLEGIDPGLQRLTKPFRGDDLANKLNMLLPDPTAGS